MVPLLIIPLSATQHTRRSPRRCRSRSTTGSRDWASVWFPGQSSQLTGRPSSLNVELQPHTYCEMSRELAEEKGIENGDWVTISSVRGQVDALAVVTHRFRPMTCGGKTIHQMGMVFNGGWLFPEDFGDTANLLTPTVGDANAFTPEYKAFMVNIAKANRS